MHHLAHLGHSAPAAARPSPSSSLCLSLGSRSTRHGIEEPRPPSSWQSCERINTEGARSTAHLTACRVRPQIGLHVSATSAEGMSAMLSTSSSSGSTRSGCSGKLVPTVSVGGGLTAHSHLTLCVNVPIPQVASVSTTQSRAVAVVVLVWCCSLESDEIDQLGTPKSGTPSVSFGNKEQLKELGFWQI